MSMKDDIRNLDALIRQTARDIVTGRVTILGHSLDPTKIDYFIDVDSPSSQLVIGVYPEGTTQEEVEAVAKRYATFGGHFRRFGGGRFEYVAWTD